MFDRIIGCQAGARPVLPSERHVTVFSSCMRVLFFLLLAVVATASAARAQSRIAVDVGHASVLVTADEEISAASAQHGTVVVQSTATTPKTYALIYFPPKGATQFVDTVAYKLGDKTVSVEVDGRTGAQQLADAKLYETSFKALFALFVLAVLVENGLALVFNWKPFLNYFDSRVVKPVIGLIFAYLFVSLFNLDIVSELMSSYSGQPISLSWPGQLLSAMIIAGGSAGVNRLMRSLGFRAMQSVPDDPKPQNDTEAWIAVRLERVNATGTVTVVFGKDKHESVIGTIVGTSKKGSFLRLFLRDKGRYPQSGGYSVGVGGPYRMWLVGQDQSGNLVESKKWGPFSLAARAIVDVTLEL